MRLRQLVIQLKSLYCGSLRFRVVIMWCCRGVRWQDNVSLRQTSISQSIVWIARNRLLIKCDCLRDVVPTAFAPKRSAFEIKLVGGQIARWLGRYQLLFRAA